MPFGSHSLTAECISNIDILQKKYRIIGCVLDMASGLPMEGNKATYGKK
jgi:hypothetical protein